MKKKITALALVICLLAVAVVGGTMAYFTDTEEATNTFTFGDVEIEQIEQERDENGNFIPFTGDKPIVPAVYEGSSLNYIPANEWEVPNDPNWKVVPTDKNAIDKFISVKNTGTSAAYVRTIIGFEVGENGLGDPYMHLVANLGDDASRGWKLEWLDGFHTVNGSVCIVGIFTHYEALDPDETTVPNIKQIYLGKETTEDIVAAYGDTFEIYAVSQAVQADGFDDAETALNEAFGEINASNLPWA